MNVIAEIYSKYRIMQNLQQHQLRVAAVAQVICDSISEPLDSKGVVRACLFHDMGNIIKSDLSFFPDFTKPEGLKFWQKVKDEYILKYGPDEHVATNKICREIGLSETELGYLDAVGFSKVKDAVALDSLEKKICCYADQRVGPHGVLPMEQRLEEGRRRYAGRKHKALGSDQFDGLAQAAKELESQIFSRASILPWAITDESITPYLTKVVL